MSRAGPIAILGACLASAAVHVAALSIGERPEDVMIATTESGGLAAIGNSFTDLAAGTATPVAPETEQPDQPEHDPTPTPEPLVTEADLPPDTLDPIIPQDTPTPTPDTVENTPPVDATPVPALAIVEDTPDPNVAHAPLIVAASSVPVVPTVPVSPVESPPPESLITPAPVATSEPPPVAVEAVAVVATETVEATDPLTLVLRAHRPPARPDDLVVPPPEPQPQRQRQDTPPPPVNPGNSDQDAVRGAAQAQPQGQDATTGQGAAPQQAEQGNAAASNYPGAVMRQLSRARRDRLRESGTAVISFTIADSGGLAGLSVARPSGVSAIDQAGMAVVQRAAPFPPPPPGAQRTFSFEFSG